MSGFVGKITKVKGLSERRRIPRLGKIRLGFKVVKGDKEFPAECPFFVLPQEVGAVYGFKSQEDAMKRAQELEVKRKDVLTFIQKNYGKLAEQIEIMLPVNDIGAVFPQAYTWYGKSKGVKCMGDGEQATRYNEVTKGMEDIECPCSNLRSDENPKGECTLRGHLQCLLPKVSMGGIYQIDTGSKNSTIDVNSGIEYVQTIMRDAGVTAVGEAGDLVGRFAMVPLILRRVPTETHFNEQKQIHYTLQLLPAPSIDIAAINRLRQDTRFIMSHNQYALPPAENINPAMDTGDVIIEGEIVGEGSGEGGTDNGGSAETQLTDEQQKEALINSIKELRRKLTKDQFEPIRAKYKPDITECTISELKAFEKEVKDAIEKKAA